MLSIKSYLNAARVRVVSELFLFLTQFGRACFFIHCFIGKKGPAQIEGNKSKGRFNHEFEMDMNMEQLP